MGITFQFVGRASSFTLFFLLKKHQNLSLTTLQFYYMP